MAVTDLRIAATVAHLGTVTFLTNGAQLVQSIAEADVEEYTFGTSVNQGDAFYDAIRVGTGAAESINLRTGSLSGKDGVAITFTTIKEFYLKNLATSGSDVISLGGNFVIGGSSSFVLGSGAITMRAQETIYVGCPVTGLLCNSSARDILSITTTSVGQTYRLRLIGEN